MVSKNEFLEFFNSDDFYENFNDSELKDIFLTVLRGSLDITPQLLNELITDYNVDNIKIVQVKKWNITQDLSFINHQT